MSEYVTDVSSTSANDPNTDKSADLARYSGDVPDAADFINHALADVISAAMGRRTSKEALARATGISSRTITRYLEAQVDMPAKSFQRIAEALNQPADQLYADALGRAQRMAAEEQRVSEVAAQNVTHLHPRDWTADEIDRTTTERRAATEVDPESETDETD
ncbi:hypothetical protein GCM10017712_04320 [Curtobacterium citreum]